MPRFALKVAGAYLLVGALWILFSDTILALLVSNLHVYARLEILKGWFFIAVTGGALYFTLRALERRRIRELHAEADKSEDRYRALFNKAPDGIVIADPDSYYIDANPGICRMLGYSRDEFIGLHASDIVSPVEVPHIDHALKTLRNKSEHQREWQFRRKDGSVFQAEVLATVMPDGNLLGVIRDTTERRKGEEALELANRQLRQAQKLESLGTMAAGIAHDFNNILGIVMGHATLLRRGRMDIDRIARSTEAIEQSAQRGAGLVRQLLTFARKSDIAFESVHINEIVTEVVKLLEETFPKVITFTTSIYEKLPSIVADASQVHQVLMNLCVNARDAMMPKGGVLTIETKLLAGDDIRNQFPDAGATEYALLKVSDTGTGMDELTRSKMFEPFFTTKEKGKGTGLGLATVYGIMKSHRGIVDVSSEVGLGSTFSVFFPVAPLQVEAPELSDVSFEEIRAGKEKILVVEDEEMLRVLARTLLESKGYIVLTACDGIEGMNCYLQNREEISLVLTDLGLPKIDGYALLDGLREINPDVRVIAMSGYIDADQRKSLFEAGVKDIIHKPFRPTDLLKRVRQVLDL